MKHKPPTDLVMKTADWGPGPDAVTTIHNSEGEVYMSFSIPNLYSPCFYTPTDDDF